MSPAPHTTAGDTVEELHGHRIADPYRWLEDPDAPETVDWVRRQNAWTREHLDALDGLPWFADTMARIVCRPRAGLPRYESGHWLMTRNDGTQAQDVWVIADTLEGLDDGEVIIDPNASAADGSTSIGAVTVSPDGSRLAAATSHGGSDWWRFDLIDLTTRQPIADEPEVYGKFSPAVWLPDNTYLYLGFPDSGAHAGTETAELSHRQLRRHRPGTSPDDDVVVLELPDEPSVSFYPWLSHDHRWVVVGVVQGTERRIRVWVLPVSEDGATLDEPIRLVDDPVAAFDFVRSAGEELIFRTDLDAPHSRVVALTPGRGLDALREIVGESDDTVLAVVAAGEELITLRLHDASPVLTRYALDGTELGALDVPGGSVVGASAEPDRIAWTVATSSVTDPLARYLVEGDRVTPLPAAAGTGFVLPQVSVERAHATSADGTRVPYWVIRPETIAAETAHPTLLYGYGGFGIPILTDYRPAWPGWLAAGGVLAIANLRGGGEFGSDWHDAGKREHKQNVFDDFIAVGDDLVATGVARRDQLAIMGGSNGGLLVGATITQRPDLAAVALPAVGVLDMLRFHLFTIGRAWVSDYGDPDDPADLEVLLRYSPLHTVVDGTHYPATLVTTGDHDDRVVPLHSHKFTATLQRAQAGPAPVLTRIGTATGHGMGKALDVLAAEYADVLAFAAHHTGLQPPQD